MSNHTLYLLGHSDLAQRPDRSERALRVFFPKSSLDYLAALQRGEEVPVRQGPGDVLGQFAATLSAQGFRCRLSAPDPAAAAAD